MNHPKEGTRDKSLQELQKEQIETLQELIQIDTDATRGFSKAQENVQSREVADAMSRYARQRDEYRDTLQRQVDALGGDPGVGEHATAKLHRWWMDAKASASKDEDKAMLDEVLRGEKRAADAYQDALESNLEDNLHRLVEEQYRGVTEARREVEQLLETL